MIVTIEVDERTLSALQAVSGTEEPPDEEDMEAFLLGAITCVLREADEATVH